MPEGSSRRGAHAPVKGEPELPAAHLRTVTVLFALLVALQFASGILLYVQKIGLHPADTLEYYAGSEVMRRVYPGRPDTFRQPRSLEGLAKFSVGHLVAFGLIAFVAGHLLRSLTRQIKRPGVDRLVWALFAAAFLDVAGGFLVRYGPAWTSYARVAIFITFCALGLLVAARLVQGALNAGGAAPIDG